MPGRGSSRRRSQDEEHERVWERVAAVDVAKASGVVCTRVPDEDRPGRRKTHVWTVQATVTGGHRAGRSPARPADPGRHAGIDQRLLADLVRDPGGRRAEGAAGQRPAVKNVPGRAKTDKKDAVWLAKLTERGMLQPSFVPPPEIRRLREFTRLRADLVHDRTRYWARLEKLLERALIKISDGDLHPGHRSGPGDDRGADRRAAQPAGPGGPGHRQGCARKRAELAEALDGRLRGPPRRAGPDPAGPDRRPDRRRSRPLTGRIGELIAQIPAAWGVDADGATGPDAGTGPDAAVLPAVARLDEITGCGIIAAQAVIAEIGLDMTVFGTPGRLVSWAKRCPQTRQSGKKTSHGKAGKGNP